jgi:hypothetical protein
MNEFSLKNNPFIFFDPEELNRQQLKEKVVDLKNNYVIERAEGPAFSSFTSFLKNIVEKGYSALESYTKSLTAKKVKTPEVKKTNGATREFVFSEKTATVKPDPIVVTKPELLIKPLKETAYQNPYLGTPAIFDIDEVMETLKTKEFVILEINSKDFSKQSQSIKNDNETIYSFNTYLGFTKKGQKSLVDFNAYNKNPVIKKFNFLGIPFLKRELHNDHPAGGETSSIYIGQGKHGRTKINSVFYIKLTGILLSSEMQSEVHTFKLEPVDKNLVMTVNPHHDSDTNRFEGHSSISQDGHALILEFRP